MACCLCSKVLLREELPSSRWSWPTSWLCLSRSSCNCCFSLCRPFSSLPYRPSKAKSLCSRKLSKQRKRKLIFLLYRAFSKREKNKIKNTSEAALTPLLNAYWIVWRLKIKSVGGVGGAESIHSAFTFHSGDCTNLHIYTRMTNRHQLHSLIGLTSYKHLYHSSTHRWPCMLSCSIIAMR